MLFDCSCDYRWQLDYPHEERPTISVPFVVGDEDGMLTNEIIRAIAASGLADVRHSSADYRLQASIVGSNVETLGYRLDRQKIKQKVGKNLVASEGRKTISIEAALYEGTSGKIAYGPYKIAADSDFDYIDGDSIEDLTFVNPVGATTTVLPFSLGQLEPSEAAQEATSRPLYTRLSQKIVEIITSEW